MDYLVCYIASAHIGVLQQWLLEDRQETPQEMAQIVSTITLNSPFFCSRLKEIKRRETFPKIDRLCLIVLK
ncbi:TetR-like C-terminal domain-containing protein [Lysinibacillus sp. NPDC093210]|uniref:TetR-like C-terminal domain-containing protein n=1 Tax=Lysinibacillus sp. NPDC093210 TaxID=3364133 RepID=UPI003801626D